MAGQNSGFESVKSTVAIQVRSLKSEYFFCNERLGMKCGFIRDISAINT
jgi:hypothetical protein